MLHLPAVVSLLAMLLLFATALAVGRGRHVYRVDAPATSGHPLFERAYRVQMNTLEACVLFLPTLWLAAHYGFARWAGGVGLLWVVARTWYAFAYLRDPKSRGPAFAIGVLCWFAVFALAALGVGRALLTV